MYERKIPCKKTRKNSSWNIEKFNNEKISLQTLQVSEIIMSQTFFYKDLECFFLILTIFFNKRHIHDQKACQLEIREIRQIKIYCAKKVRRSLFGVPRDDKLFNILKYYIVCFWCLPSNNFILLIFYYNIYPMKNVENF